MSYLRKLQDCIAWKNILFSEKYGRIILDAFNKNNKKVLSLIYEADRKSGVGSGKVQEVFARLLENKSVEMSDCHRAAALTRKIEKS